MRAQSLSTSACLVFREHDQPQTTTTMAAQDLSSSRALKQRARTAKGRSERKCANGSLTVSQVVGSNKLVRVSGEEQRKCWVHRKRVDRLLENKKEFKQVSGDRISRAHGDGTGENAEKAVTGREVAAGERS